MALFPGGGKPVSISHVSIDADSLVPSPLPWWRPLVAHTSLPVPDYNGSPSCLLAHKFLPHWGFPASPPCLVVASGWATMITWTQCPNNPFPCSAPGSQSLVVPTAVSANVSLYLIPFSFHFQFHRLLYFTQNGSQMSGKYIGGLGTEDAPSRVLVIIISAPRRAMPGWWPESSLLWSALASGFEAPFRTPQVVGMTKTLQRSCAVRSLLPGVQEPSFTSCHSKTRLHLGPNGCHNVSPLGIYLLFPGWPLKIGAGSGGIVLTMHTLQPLFPHRRAAGSLPGQHCNFINSGSEKPIFIMLIRRAHI